MQSPELLSKLIDYNPETGKMVWKPRSPADFADRKPKHGTDWAANNWNKLYAGKEICSVRDDGYITVMIFKKQHRAHRIAWSIYYNEHPFGYIDHVNGVKTDNRISNLRIVSPLGNARNSARPKSNKSGVAGVYFNTSNNKWAAKIGVGNGKSVHLGCFHTIEEAIAARIAAKKVLGYSERHG